MKSLSKTSANVIDQRDQTGATKQKRQDLNIGNLETKKVNQARKDYIKSSPTPSDTPFQDQINSINQIGQDAAQKRKQQIAKDIGDLGRTNRTGDNVRHQNVTRSNVTQEGDLTKNDPFTEQPQWDDLSGYNSQGTPGEWKVKK